VTDVAVISAAGWKGAGELNPLVEAPDFLKPTVTCPEALLPLGDGSTVTSRLMSQLSGLGFRCIVGVGMPDSLFPRAAQYYTGDNPGEYPFITQETAQVGRTISPWTERRVEHLAQFGEVVRIPSSDVGGRQDTAYRILRRLNVGQEDGVLLVSGDFMFSDGYLEAIIALPRPCQFQTPAAKHLVYWINGTDLPAYRCCARRHRGWDHLEFVHSRGSTCLTRAGMRFVTTEEVFGDKYEIGNDWFDVDYHWDYKYALKWVKGKGASRYV